ncbi:MAG: helix-turn-helix transcriptional regulator [Patescibacteria group bacterium]|nr:helix-turn-helix transcriptional regulator [Patescibacteria group bacterium]
MVDQDIQNFLGACGNDKIRSRGRQKREKRTVVYPGLARRVRDGRRALGMTLDQFADHIPLGRDTVRRAEGGESLRRATLVKLGNVLGYTAEALIADL